MNKILITLILLVSTTSVWSQIDNAAVADEPDTAEFFEIAEQMPFYPGGDSARQRFIATNMIYPDSAVNAGKQGTVIVQFIVEKDGNLSHVTAYRTFDKFCAAEAVRVVKLMKWEPGMLRGKPVRVKISMPIKFKLS